MQRNWPAALADFRKHCDLNPREQDVPRLVIWLIRARLGQRQEAADELAVWRDLRAREAPDNWPAKIAAFLLGKLSEEELLAAAAAPDARKERDRYCDAWFYVGIKWLLAGDSAAADARFRKCLATEMKPNIHYQFAQAELIALGR
jgi:lipoprotein NlpI